MNKYSPSLFDTEDSICWKCGYVGDTVRHEAYCGRGTRDKSKKYGLWVCLCPRCHSMVHKSPGEGLDKELRDKGRLLFENAYPEKDFIKIFVRGAEKNWED